MSTAIVHLKPEQEKQLKEARAPNLRIVRHDAFELVDDEQLRSFANTFLKWIDEQEETSLLLKENPFAELRVPDFYESPIEVDTKHDYAQEGIDEWVQDINAWCEQEKVRKEQEWQSKPKLERTLESQLQLLKHFAPLDLSMANTSKEVVLDLYKDHFNYSPLQLAHQERELSRYIQRPLLFKPLSYEIEDELDFNSYAKNYESVVDRMREDEEERSKKVIEEVRKRSEERKKQSNSYFRRASRRIFGV